MIAIVVILAIIGYFLFVRKDEDTSSQSLGRSGAITRVIEPHGSFAYVAGATGSVNVKTLPS